MTLNAIAHIDPLGLAMIILVGFGYAKPVPTDPRDVRVRRANLWVATAWEATVYQQTTGELRQCRSSSYSRPALLLRAATSTENEMCPRTSVVW